MRIDTWEEFEKAVLKLARKYKLKEAELSELVEQKKQELSRIFDGEVLPANLFNSIKAALARKHIVRGGAPHLVCIVSDSGAFNYVAKQYREAVRQYREDPEGAIQAGLVAGTRHPEVLAGRAKPGDPIGSDGKVHRVRKMRMMRVVVAPIVEGSNEADIRVCQATLWDEDAVKFKAEYFTWFVAQGVISSDGQWFNFRDIEKKPVPEELKGSLPPAYDFVVENNIVKRVRLGELYNWFTVAEKRYIEAIDTEETSEPVIVEATVIDMQLDNERTYGDRSFYRFILDDGLDPDCDEILRVNVPTFMPIKFAVDSRVAVVGKVRRVSEEFGGGWQIWQAEALYPIPGMYYPRYEPGAPGFGIQGTEVKAEGVVKKEPEPPQGKQAPDAGKKMKIEW